MAEDVVNKADEKNEENVLPGLEETNEESILPGVDEVSEESRTDKEAETSSVSDLELSESVKKELEAAVKVAMLTGSDVVVLNDANGSEIKIFFETQEDGKLLIDVGGIPTVVDDPEDMEQILESIYGNLSKFTAIFDFESAKAAVLQPAEKQQLLDERAKEKEEKENDEKNKELEKEMEKEEEEAERENQNLDGEGIEVEIEEEDPLKEELKAAIRKGKATELKMNEEIGRGQDGKLVWRDMFGVNAQRMWRVRGDNPNDFKYLGMDSEGKMVDTGGNESRGKNPTDRITIKKADGTVETKMVNNIKVFGDYILATDVPFGGRPSTLVGRRGIDGNIEVNEVLESRNNMESKDQSAKDKLLRGRSIFETGDTTKATEIANQTDALSWDGTVTVEEVNYVKRLREKGIEQDVILDFLDFVHTLREVGLKEDKVVEIMANACEKTVREAAELSKNDFCNREQAEEVLNLKANEGKTLKEAAIAVREEKEEVKEEREEEDEGRTLWGDAEARRAGRR